MATLAAAKMSMAPKASKGKMPKFGKKMPMPAPKAAKPMKGKMPFGK